MTNPILSEQATLAVTAYSRPLRVSFLIHNEGATPAELNEIVRYCSGKWGGRLHTIVPTDGATIADDWWNCLRFGDPDYVLSLVPLREELRSRIERHIAPAVLRELSEQDRSRRGENHLIGRLEIEALGSEHLVAHVLGRRAHISPQKLYYIADSSDNAPRSSWIVRNFGVFSDVLHVQNALRGVPRTVLGLSEANERELVKALCEYGTEPVWPLLVSRMLSPRTNILGYSPDNSAFHLGVGDGALDFAYAWNRGVIADHWITLPSLWLSKEQSEDEELLALVGTLIQRRYWASADRHGVVVSYSLTAAACTALARKMATLAGMWFEARIQSSDRFPLPEFRQVGRGTDFLGEAKPSSFTTQVPLSESSGVIQIPRPPFLLSGEGQGAGWMVDLDVQFHPERFSYTNVRPSWRLPRREALAFRFFRVSKGVRVVADGYPARFVTEEESVVRFHVPSDLDVIAGCVLPERSSDGRPDKNITGLTRSDAGAAFDGVVSLFGHLYAAGHVLEGRFWWSVFQKLAGGGARAPEEDEDRIAEALRAAVESDGDIKDGDAKRLASVAIAISRAVRLKPPRPRSMSLDQFHSHYGKMIQHAQSGDDRDQDWARNEDFTFHRDYELPGLVEASVLLQGVELRCDRCGTLSWYGIGELGASVVCAGCLVAFPCDVGPTWRFRLNELLGVAVRDRGTIPEIRTVWDIQQACWDSMVVYLPCMNVLREDDTVFTDLDVAVVAAGKFIIGEVKTDPSSFRPEDFEKLLAVAQKAVPDLVVIAALGALWPPATIAAIAKVEEELGLIGVRVVRHQIGHFFQGLGS